VRALPAPQRDLDRAVALFGEALRIEPDFAEAWSAIGDVWTERALTGMDSVPRRNALAHARPALDRALALDAHCAEALNDRGLLLMHFDRAYAQAELALRKSVAADPRYADARHNLATLLAAMGQHEQAIAQYRALQALDPGEAIPSTTLAFLYLLGYRYSDAAAEYHASLLVLGRPNASHWGMMSAAVSAGRWDDAARSLSAILGRPVELKGSSDRAILFRRELARLEDGLLARERAMKIDPYAVACYYAMAQKPDPAFAALDRAIAAQSMNAIFAFVDPRLESIRSDERFNARLAKLGFRR
jgi:tetratricopeptide (TPR) repeat protein